MTRQNTWLLSSLIAGTAIVIMAFTGDPGNQDDNLATADTIPSKSRETTRPGDRDLDREIRELEKARIHLKDIDLKKIQADINASLKDINIEKIKLDIEKSLKDIDVEKIERDVEASIAKIDFDKIERDIEQAFDKVEITMDKKEMEKLKEELKKVKVEIRNEFKDADFKKEMEQLKKIDLKEIEKDLEDARKEIEKMKIDIELEKADFKVDLEKAREDIEAARVELKGYQEMIYAMEKDGLLDTNKDYSIDYKDGELRINDKKQSDSVTGKYKRYFKEDIRLEKKNGRFEIDHLKEN
jgi:hypothetical protein